MKKKMENGKGQAVSKIIGTSHTAQLSDQYYRHFAACYVLTRHVASSSVVDVSFFTEDDVFFSLESRVMLELMHLSHNLGVKSRMWLIL